MMSNVPIIDTIASPDVPIPDRDIATLGIYRPDMLKDRLKDWLVASLELRKMSQAELARRRTETLSRAIPRSAVNKMALGSREISVLERDALAGQLKHVETVAVNGTAKDRARQEPELGRDHRLALTYQASAERHTAGERTSGFGRPSNVSKWRFPKFASAQESRSSVLNPGAELTVIDAATACSSATNPATAGLRCSPLRNVTKMRRRIAGRISFNSNVPI